MKFYDKTKEQRKKVVEDIYAHIFTDIHKNAISQIYHYFADEDTYTRKAAYMVVGKIYFSDISLHDKIIAMLGKLLNNAEHPVRQTAINAAGEIGLKHFEIVEPFFDSALFDEHHTVRNAVIGSIKKMGAKNPVPVLYWAKKYLHHPDKEIRREICHGIELRGRTHPQDILPLLKELQFDNTARVRTTLIHVLGQISYKKGCLATVVAHLKNWKNTDLVNNALLEIIEVHERYKDFAVLTKEQAKKYIMSNM